MLIVVTCSWPAGDFDNGTFTNKAHVNKLTHFGGFEDRVTHFVPIVAYTIHCHVDCQLPCHRSAECVSETGDARSINPPPSSSLSFPGSDSRWHLDHREEREATDVRLVPRSGMNRLKTGIRLWGRWARQRSEEENSSREIEAPLLEGRTNTQRPQ